MSSRSESPWYKLIFYGLEFFGRYYSTYSGIVIDNNDPRGLNRLKVVYPQLIKDDTEGTWAFPNSSWGGKNYGIQMLPKIGDMVNLQFSHGDLEYPLWTHGSYADNEKPEEFSDPNIYGFKSPKGNIILIDEINENGYILVKFKNNKEYIKISKDILEQEAKLIKLGKEGHEWAVLGETLKAKMDSILTIQKLNQDLLLNHTHTTNTGVSGPPINSIEFDNIGNKFEEIRNSLEEILSKKVKLDK